MIFCVCFAIHFISLTRIGPASSYTRQWKRHIGYGAELKPTVLQYLTLISLSYCHLVWARIAHSVWRLATGWTDRGSKPIPVAERSKARVCCRSLAGVAGSNPTGGMGVCVVCCKWRQKEKCRTIKTKTQVRLQYRVQNRIPVGGEISRTRPDRSWGPLSTYPEVKERVELYLCSPTSSWLVLGRTLPLPFSVM